MNSVFGVFGPMFPPYVRKCQKNRRCTWRRVRPACVCGRVLYLLCIHRKRVETKPQRHQRHRNGNLGRVLPADPLTRPSPRLPSNLAVRCRACATRAAEVSPGRYVVAAKSRKPPAGFLGHPRGRPEGLFPFVQIFNQTTRPETPLFVEASRPARRLG